ncbi:RDD family protein [Planomicrobium sp. YIM 101495]|uniref:RDD family protein n=1 Tax=Planomicrobium sp. YIM 101495 TaxID=2665160 RepID=UPI0012BA1C53|nr:RDD family protein [Planomicrobium sp. YIM 101495]MTD29566.1 RDD family protein [Planomicrobium sp. YIM 101495]
MAEDVHNEGQERVTLEKERHVTPQYSETIAYERKPAGFWVRFWAYLLDVAVIWGITSILLKPVFGILGMETGGTEWYAPYAILSAILFYSYFVLMTKFFRQTLGKMVMGIQVVSLKQEKLTWGTLLFREWIGRFLSVTILPLYWLVGFTPLKQGVHDFIADTTVIHEASYRERKVRVESVGRNELQQTEAFD